MCGPSSRMRSRSWWARLLRSSSRGLSCIVLLSVLCLPILPAFGQSSLPTSPLGSQDYVQFQTDSAILKARWTASQEALTAALQQKQIIENNLADATQRYDDLLASVTAHSGDSTTYLQQLLTEIKTLRGQLKDSQTLVAVLRGNLESAKAEYEARLKTVQDRAKALERENGWLKVGIVAAVIVAAAAGVYAAVK